MLAWLGTTDDTEPHGFLWILAVLAVGVIVYVISCHDDYLRVHWNALFRRREEQKRAAHRPYSWSA
jgi:hypothetical protein